MARNKGDAPLKGTIVDVLLKVKGGWGTMGCTSSTRAFEKRRNRHADGDSLIARPLKGFEGGEKSARAGRD